MPFLKRLATLRKRFKAEGLNGFIVIDRCNTHYFTGFRGTASLLIVMPDVTLFLTDSRYYEHARKNLPPGVEVVLQKQDGRSQLKGFFDVRGKLRIGFESSISYAKSKWLGSAIRPARLVEADQIVRDMRIVKDEQEIRLVKKAASIVDRCMMMLKSEIKPGITERDLAIKIRRFFEDKGAWGESFPAIVAFGPNAALPHHETSRRKLKKGDAVLVDMGCRFQGYCSDMTRTLFLGEADKSQREIYGIVLEAQKEGLKAVQPGIPAREVDRVVRQVISRAGYMEAFGHNTGHGAGLDVHEPPVIGPRSEYILRQGMIITVEPGIYLPGRFGVRIEDLVLVTPGGSRRLSRSSKKLTVIS